MGAATDANAVSFVGRQRGTISAHDFVAPWAVDGLTASRSIVCD